MPLSLKQVSGLRICLTKGFPCGSSPRDNQCHLHLSGLVSNLHSGSQCSLVRLIRRVPDRSLFTFSEEDTRWRRGTLEQWHMLPSFPCGFFPFLTKQNKLKGTCTSEWCVVEPAERETQLPRPEGTFVMPLKGTLSREPFLCWKFPVCMFVFNPNWSVEISV